MATKRTGCVPRIRTAAEKLRAQSVQATTENIARIPFGISAAVYTDQHRSVSTWILQSVADHAAILAATDIVEDIVRPIIVRGSGPAPHRIPLRCRTNMPPDSAKRGAIGDKDFAWTAVHG